MIGMLVLLAVVFVEICKVLLVGCLCTKVCRSCCWDMCRYLVDCCIVTIVGLVVSGYYFRCGNQACVKRLSLRCMVYCLHCFCCFDCPMDHWSVMDQGLWCSQRSCMSCVLVSRLLVCLPVFGNWACVKCLNLRCMVYCSDSREASSPCILW